jgi:hypothetical protein
VPTVDEWIKRWNADRYALALLPPDRYAYLAAQHLPMQVVARDARRVIVEKPVAEAQPAAALPHAQPDAQPGAPASGAAPASGTAP